MRSLIALVAVMGLVGVYGMVDRMDRYADDQISYRQWVADACTPAPGETAIATHEAGKLHCTIYSRNSLGFAPVIVSAAVMEVPL
jgi:hypothetical protein